MCSVHCLKADTSAERLFLTQSQFELFFAIMLAKFLVNYEGLHFLEETKVLNFLKMKQQILNMWVSMYLKAFRQLGIAK